MLFVRTYRGKCVHLRDGCVPIERQIPISDEDEFLSRCTRCFHRGCFVCLSDTGGVPTECDQGHAMCEACLHTYVNRGGLGCPCSPAETADASVKALQRLPPKLMETAWQKRNTICQPCSTEWIHDLGAALRAHAWARCCPHCNAKFDDFDGCAALKCSKCHGYFCGLCMHAASASEDAHAHVRDDCPANPLRGISYFVSHEYVEVAWKARAQQRILDALGRIEITEGKKCADEVRASVARADDDLEPALREPTCSKVSALAWAAAIGAAAGALMRT